MTFESSFGGIVGDNVLKRMDIRGDERLFCKVRNTEREADRG